MNRIRIILSGIAAVATLSLTSCAAEEQLPEVKNAEKGEFINFDITSGKSLSRAQVEADGKSVVWTQGDMFSIAGYCRENDEYVRYTECVPYTLKAEFHGQKSGKFEGEMTYGSGNDHKFEAYYPHSAESKGVIPAVQTYDCTSANYDISSYDFLMGAVEGVEKGTAPEITVERMTAMMNLELTNLTGEDRNMTYVKLTAEGGRIIAGTFTPDWTLPYSLDFTEGSNEITVNVANGYVAENSKITVKLIFNPSNLTSTQMDLEVGYNDGRTFETTFAGHNFVASGNYLKKISLTASVTPLVIYDGESMNPSWWKVGSAFTVDNNWNNPSKDAVNSSEFCVSVWRNPADDLWTGGGIGDLDLDPTECKVFKLMVYKDYPGDVQLEVQGEGDGSKHLRAYYDTPGQWQELSFTLPSNHTFTKITTLLVAPHAEDEKDNPGFEGSRMYWDGLIAFPEE